MVPYDVIILVAAVVVILALLVGTFYTVEQRSVAIVQRLGRFVRESEPGLHAKIPLLERVAGRMNLRVQQLDVRIETKSLDNVFVNMTVSVQFFVLPERVYDAFYRLEDAQRQITSYVFDVVRAQVPRTSLDDVFAKKDEIAEVVKVELSHVMEGFGYGILQSLVTDIEPDARVKEAMNEINYAQRMRVAATEKGEADRILKVKHAEGEAQSRALQGKGIADQRAAIIAGLRDSVDEFRRAVPGTTATNIMSIVLMTQYFDVMRDIGATSRSNAVFVPHSPSAVASLEEQIRQGMMEAQQAAVGLDDDDGVATRRHS
ncbi:MAG: SPFH domain-containing protein [Deltaproteobacteria bacterium]|nr:SPFH domain-containing protein [Kofleriaceae bacterium]